MSIDHIYIEDEIRETKTTKEIVNRIPGANVISCASYREVFNRRGQDFHLQKRNPSLILAKKYGEFLHPIPASFSIGSKHNYYFSHFLNCPYDCNYCYLQGMFTSAHYVFFTNFGDFKNAITQKVEEVGRESITFYSGYDGDSLAMEPITHFCDEFLPFWDELPSNAELEIRTKSPLVAPFLKRRPSNNVVVAYTLNPDPIAKKFETRAPSLKVRLNAMCKIADRGWKIGLRFDPVIDVEEFEEIYSDFFDEVFSRVDQSSIHSATLGAFRLPKATAKKMSKSCRKDGLVDSLQRDCVIPFCQNILESKLPKKKVFVCQEPSSSQDPAQGSEKLSLNICSDKVTAS